MANGISSPATEACRTCGKPAVKHNTVDVDACTALEARLAALITASALPYAAMARLLSEDERLSFNVRAELRDLARKVLR